MIITRRWWAVPGKARWLFSFAQTTEKESTRKTSFIKNDIPHFEDDNYDLYMHPIYPQLALKGTNTFSVSSEKIVLYLKFVPKLTTNEWPDVANQEDLSFSFKYAHLAALIGVEPNSNSSTFIVRQRMKDKARLFQSLSVRDDPKGSQVSLVIRQSRDENEQKLVSGVPVLTFNCPYWQYRLLHILIKKSLFDLSGMHLMHEIKRMQELGELSSEYYSQKKSMENQINSFYEG